MTTWIGKKDIKELLQISERTLARYRSDYWYIGIHYTKPVQKVGSPRSPVVGTRYRF